jgi:hypothetical protein
MTLNLVFGQRSVGQRTLAPPKFLASTLTSVVGLLKNKVNLRRGPQLTAYVAPTAKFLVMGLRLAAILVKCQTYDGAIN